MPKLYSHTRFLALAFALAALAAVLTWPAPPVTAAMCDDGSSSGISSSWLFTAEAQQRTLQGDCQPNFRCVEWCTLSCDVPEPQGVFKCVPE